MTPRIKYKDAPNQKKAKLIWNNAYLDQSGYNPLKGNMVTHYELSSPTNQHSNLMSLKSFISEADKAIGAAKDDIRPLHQNEFLGDLKKKH